MWGWPESEPAICLLLPHSNESQLIAQQNIQESDLKRVILRQVDCCQEQHRQRFRLLVFFWDICRRWLLAKQHSTDDIINLVVLEQSIITLPIGTTEWVQYHCLVSSEEAVRLVEDHLMTYSEQTSPPPSLSLPGTSETSAVKWSYPQIDVPKLIWLQQLQPAWDLIPKRSWDTFWGWLAVTASLWSRGWSYAILCSVQPLHSPTSLSLFSDRCMRHGAVLWCRGRSFPCYTSVAIDWCERLGLAQ